MPLDREAPAAVSAPMERLLYEQQQTRSEQEAISEIERSRFGRGAGFTIRRSAYDSVNLIFTILSVLFVVATTKPEEIRRVLSGQSDLRQLASVLWPIAAVAVVLYLIVPGVSLWLRQRRERMNSAELRPTDRKHFARRIQFHRARAERNHRSRER